MERQENTEYILSLSYGKDSIACIEAIKQLGYPLDRIIHAEIWATDDINADLPPMLEFKAKADKIIKERYGYEVEKIYAKDKDGSKLTYEKIFYRELSPKSKIYQKRLEEYKNANPSPDVEEDIYGFPYVGNGGGVSDLRLIQSTQELPPPISRKNSERQSDTDGQQLSSQECGVTYSKSILSTMQNIGIPNTQGELVYSKTQEANSQLLPPHCRRESTDSQCSEIPIVRENSSEITGKFSNTATAQGGKKNIVQYLGIAADEPKRIERHHKKGIILPLVDIGWDEPYCMEWCRENDLLSPIYESTTRGGCWFCHNQRLDSLRLLRKDYPDLWKLMLKWDSDSPVTFKPDGHTIHDYDKRFVLEELGLVPMDRKFRWKMLEEDYLYESVQES